MWWYCLLFEIKFQCPAVQFDNQDGAYKSMMNQAARFRDEPQIMWFQITMSYFPENKESEGWNVIAVLERIQQSWLNLNRSGAATSIWTRGELVQMKNKSRSDVTCPKWSVQIVEPGTFLGEQHPGHDCDTVRVQVRDRLWHGIASFTGHWKLILSFHWIRTGTESVADSEQQNPVSQRVDMATTKPAAATSPATATLPSSSTSLSASPSPQTTTSASLASSLWSA